MESALAKQKRSIRVVVFHHVNTQQQLVNRRVLGQLGQILF